MTSREQVLDFYRKPAGMAAPGAHAALLEGLPPEVAELVRVVQGRLVHLHVAPFAYGLTLSDEQREQAHLRTAEQRLELMRAQGERLERALPVAERQCGTCRDFTLLLVAALRAAGAPARSRCGFGTYFSPGFHEDHWVAEYWSAGEGRWVRVDAQIDAEQRTLFTIDFDLLDVPHDRFVIAGDAWALCRAGQADPATFGMSGMNEAGLWWIAGNMLRDAAALNGVEMLPWDVWGAMPAPDEEIDDELLALFDRLATLTRAPDEHFDELRALYAADPRVRVPAEVFNAVRQRPEQV